MMGPLHLAIPEEVAGWLRWGSLMVLMLWGFWRGLPAVLDAFERRQSGIETRTEALLDAQAKRFAEQLSQADARHDECMEGQRLLRAEMASIRKENSELWGIVNAMRQGALSVENIVAKTIADCKEPKE